MIRGDDDILHLTGPVFDGIYAYCRHAMLLGRRTSMTGSTDAQSTITPDSGTARCGD